LILKFDDLEIDNFDVYGISFLLGFGIVSTNYKNYTIELIPPKLFYDHCSCKNSKKQGGKRIEVKRTFVERKNRKEQNIYVKNLKIILKVENDSEFWIESINNQEKIF